MDILNSRQTTLREFGLVFLITIMLAGCTIPSPDEVFAEEEECIKDWSTMNGSFTYLINDLNNSTQETVVLDFNSTYGLIELDYFYYNLTHLSFDIVNNTVIFNNFTFNVEGYAQQGTHLWSNGYAPQFGSATLVFPVFPFDVTVEYEVKYRVWNGRECSQQ
tara:strand:- start:19094 stop:19579 length:486 start_codon:yes stop_codon:yes gene_type:complete